MELFQFKIYHHLNVSSEIVLFQNGPNASSKVYMIKKNQEQNKTIKRKQNKTKAKTKQNKTKTKQKTLRIQSLKF